MNKKTVFAVLLSTAVVASSLPLAVTANASDVVYGTMEIPYSEFYSSEGVDGVDTVSSATTNKWKNENGVSRKKWAFRYSKIEKCGIMII